MRQMIWQITTGQQLHFPQEYLYKSQPIVNYQQFQNKTRVCVCVCVCVIEKQSEQGMMKPY